MYNEIKTLNNASYYIYDLEKEAVNKKVYFKIKENSEDNFDYLVDQLSVALKNAIKRRTTKYYKKKVVFLSGGSDSRTILNNSYDNIEAITLYYKYNYEIEISERLTKTLNKKHNLIKRSENYYFDAFDKSIELNGGRSLPTDDHFINIAKHASILQYDSILTGCYADWMFKGIALDRAKISLFGKLKLPLYKLITFNYDFFSKRTKVNEKYEKLIKAREDKIFKNKGDLFDNEVNRIFPLFQEETSSTRLTLQQLFPWDTIFSDNDIINIYMQIPVKYKINSEVYDAAVAKLTKNIDYIPHANKRHKIGLNKYLGALLYLKSIVVNKIKRIFGMLKKDSLAGEGSWISFQEYSRNEKIINLWNEVKKDESLYGDILDNKDMDIDSIRKYDYKLIYKIITISKIFSQIKK